MTSPEAKPLEQFIALQNKIAELEKSLKKQQLKTRKKIKDLRQHYESMLAIMPGHVYWLDRSNRYLGCNDLHAKTVGLPSRQAIIGKTNHDMPWHKQAFLLDAVNNQVMETGISITVEEEVDTVGGHHAYLSHKAPLWNQKSEVVGILGVSLDISEQKLTAKRLAEALDLAEAANQAKNAFIANMSHDIRTPLSGIVGMSSLLLSRLTNPEDQQYASWIHECGNQLMNLLNHILELISSNHLKENAMQEELFSLRTLIQEMVHLEQPTIHLKELNLHLELDPAIPEYIYTDRFKLHRILLNLLGNAVKFTQHGYIELRVKVEQETDQTATLTFHIKDTGIGIPLMAQPYVFDRFFRANPSDKGPYPGSGVGLHIVKTYLELLGGTINIESEELKGSTFTFSITVNKAPPSHPHLNTTPAPIQPISHVTTEYRPNLSCLLIEDNPIALKLLEQLLLKLGYSFQSTTSAEAGLTQLTHHPVDLIITDLGLPGISGIDMSRLIRQQPQFNHTKILGLTAHCTTEIEETCLKAGMDAVLIKPIDLNQLRTSIQQLLAPEMALQPEPLGKDLPSTDAELFQLGIFPLIDPLHAIELLGEQSILKDMLQMMIHEQIPHDLPLLHEAYEKRAWSKIESIAHKMKAGALYCGTVRLQIACQYLERYHKTGRTEALEALYTQLLQTISDTILAIQEVDLG